MKPKFTRPNHYGKVGKDKISEGERFDVRFKNCLYHAVPHHQYQNVDGGSRFRKKPAGKLVVKNEFVATPCYAIIGLWQGC